METTGINPGRYSTPVSVLVVDADPNQAGALAVQLRECGYRVIEATSYGDARRLWDAEQPQVLVADVRLDGFNGLQLLIRARAIRPDVTGIITSAVADRVLSDEIRRLGGTFLLKPVDLDAIVGAIEQRVPAVISTSKVSLASLIYREFHDDNGGSAVVARRHTPRPDHKPPAGAPQDPTPVRAMRRSDR